MKNDRMDFLAQLKQERHLAHLVSVCVCVCVCVCKGVDVDMGVLKV